MLHAAIMVTYSSHTHLQKRLVRLAAAKAAQQVYLCVAALSVHPTTHLQARLLPMASPRGRQNAVAVSVTTSLHLTSLALKWTLFSPHLTLLHDKHIYLPYIYLTTKHPRSGISDFTPPSACPTELPSSPPLATHTSICTLASLDIEQTCIPHLYLDTRAFGPEYRDYFALRIARCRSRSA